MLVVINNPINEQNSYGFKSHGQLFLNANGLKRALQLIRDKVSSGEISYEEVFSDKNIGKLYNYMSNIK